MINESDLDIQYPDIVFGIGDYKTGVYKMAEGFEELKAAIESQIVCIIFVMILKQYLLSLFGYQKFLNSLHQILLH